MVFYVWALLAGALLYFGYHKYRLWIGYQPWTDIRLPKWTGINYRLYSIWSWGIWSWVWLMVAFTVRALAARHLTRKYRLPIEQHFPDRWPRRFACFCFLASVLVIAPHTDRCTHGEYWELWRTVGIERDIAGGFCERHTAFCIHLGGPWHMYWRTGRWIG